MEWLWYLASLVGWALIMVLYLFHVDLILLLGLGVANVLLALWRWARSRVHRC